MLAVALLGGRGGRGARGPGLWGISISPGWGLVSEPGTVGRCAGAAKCTRKNLSRQSRFDCGLWRCGARAESRPRTRCAPTLPTVREHGIAVGFFLCNTQVHCPLPELSPVPRPSTPFRSLSRFTFLGGGWTEASVSFSVHGVR